MTCEHQRVWSVRRIGPRHFLVGPREKMVRGYCAKCGVEMYAPASFTEWVDANKVLTAMGGACMLQECPEFADHCGCADCQRHDRPGADVHGYGGY